MQQRGLNDWTPPHYTVSLDDGDAVEPLLENGADIARARIDDWVTPVRAESCGCKTAISALSIFGRNTSIIVDRCVASGLRTSRNLPLARRPGRSIR